MTNPLGLKTPHGVRITAVDLSLRGSLVLVPHHRRTIGEGVPKTYNVRLDGEGSAVVSETVWRRLEEIMAANPGSPRFVVTGMTSRPPHLLVGGDGTDTVPVVRFNGRTYAAFGEMQVPKLRLKG